MATGYNAILISKDYSDNWTEIKIEDIEDTNIGIELNDNSLVIAVIIE